MAENHQNNFPSPPPEQPPFPSTDGSNQLFNFDNFIDYSADEQPPLGVDMSVSLQDKDPGVYLI